MFFERELVYLNESPSFYCRTLPAAKRVPPGSTIIKKGIKNITVNVPARPGDILLRSRVVKPARPNKGHNGSSSSGCFIATIFDQNLA